MPKAVTFQAGKSEWHYATVAGSTPSPHAPGGTAWVFKLQEGGATVLAQRAAAQKADAYGLKIGQGGQVKLYEAADKMENVEDIRAFKDNTKK